MEILSELAAIVGDRHVLTGPEIGKFGSDWAGGLTWVPLCVVRPASTQEVSAVLRATYGAGVAVVPVAGNTGVSGGAYAEGAVMLSLERMNRIAEINPARRTATVEAGVIVANLHAAVSEHDLVFPLLFGAQGTAQVGGALSTNAGGSNVLRFGNVRALCLGVEVVLPDGRVMDLMSSLHKDNTGYDLRDLMIGAEGTLGVITGAVLKLVPRPQTYVTAMIAFDDLDDALVALHKIQATSGDGVEAFEYMPDLYIERHMARFSGARAPFDQSYPVNVLAQVAATNAADGVERADGTNPLFDRVAECLGALIEEGAVKDAVLAKSEAEVAEMWARRDAAAELALADKPYVGADLAFPTDAMGTFLERANPAVAKTDPGCQPFWVAHLGDGNIHYTVRITDSARYDRVTEVIEDIVEDLGGSFSAEHGVGLFKRNTMARRKDGVAVDVMRAIKSALDPKGLMNPSKVLPDAPDLPRV